MGNCRSSSLESEEQETATSNYSNKTESMKKSSSDAKHDQERFNALQQEIEHLKKQNALLAELGSPNDSKSSSPAKVPFTVNIYNSYTTLMSGDFWRDQQLEFLADLVQLKRKYATNSETTMEIQSLLDNHRLLISGYMKRTDVSILAIPMEILDIVCSYFCGHGGEKIVCKDENMEVSNQGKSITVLNNGKSFNGPWRVAYGSIAIPSNSQIHCYWNIKLENLANVAFIGVVTKPIHQTEQKDYVWMHQNENVFYAFGGSGSGGGWRLKNYVSREKDYAVPPKVGDTLTVDLNMREKQVKWLINGEDRGIQVDEIRTGSGIDYYLAIAMGHHHMKLTVLEFGEIVL